MNTRGHQGAKRCIYESSRLGSVTASHWQELYMTLCCESRNAATSLPPTARDCGEGQKADGLDLLRPNSHTQLHGWLSKRWSPFGSPKYQVPFDTRDPKGDHNFDNHPHDVCGTLVRNLRVQPNLPWTGVFILASSAGCKGSTIWESG